MPLLLLMIFFLFICTYSNIASRSQCSAQSGPYCHSRMFVCLDVGHSTTYSLPRLIDHSQIWSAGTYLSLDPCKPFWIPYLPYFRCQMEKYGKFSQTLHVLQFVIEFANIWAQYSPSTYASTHVGFFDLCPNVQMAAL